MLRIITGLLKTDCFCQINVIKKNVNILVFRNKTKSSNSDSPHEGAV